VIEEKRYQVQRSGSKSPMQYQDASDDHRDSVNEYRRTYLRLRLLETCFPRFDSNFLLLSLWDYFSAPSHSLSTFKLKNHHEVKETNPIPIFQTKLPKEVISLNRHVKWSGDPHITYRVAPEGRVTQNSIISIDPIYIDHHASRSQYASWSRIQNVCKSQIIECVQYCRPETRDQYTFPWPVTTIEQHLA
jgi:hypothetical protein